LVIRAETVTAVQGALPHVGDPLGDRAFEAELARRSREGDVGAFDQIVERYEDRIYSFVRRMVRDPRDAEDASQDVFVKAYEGIRQFDGRASLGTWLFRIASNVCIDLSRRKARRIDPLPLERNGDSEEAIEVPDERYDPERIVIEGEMQGVIEHAVVRLSEKLRTVLLLHDMENLSYEEIAEVVKVPLGTVKSRLYLAREQLREALRGYLREGGG
jgi:RNA polymerase sigma-70 factor, ECF subfamily